MPQQWTVEQRKRYISNHGMAFVEVMHQMKDTKIPAAKLLSMDEADVGDEINDYFKCKDSSSDQIFFTEISILSRKVVGQEFKCRFRANVNDLANFIQHIERWEIDGEGETPLKMLG